MYTYEIQPSLKKKLERIFKKKKSLYLQILKKIEEVIDSEDISHYKNLKYNLKDLKRVHVGSFVLVFKVVKDKVIFIDFDHHDKIYK